MVLAPTDRLYYQDSYLRTFTAQVTNRQGDRIYLDATAFYPTSGGQPNDFGSLNGVPVRDVVDEGKAIAHVMGGPVEADHVTGEVDWARRFDHMQQHTGQHLLSAVLAEQFGIKTLSFHLGAENSTIEVDVPELRPETARAVEERCQQIIYENRPVTVSYREAGAASGLRKAPEREGTLRIITIEKLDQSACGGTHIRATGEIGVLLLRGADKVRGNARLEFLCGMRAARQARQDFELLSEAAKLYSAPLTQVPALAASTRAQSAEMQKQLRALEAEAATLSGQALYEQQLAGQDGIRRVWQISGEATLRDRVRVEAQAYTSRSSAIFVHLARPARALLVAVSKDAGLHAGNLLKAALQSAGGRGGGSDTLAQGTVPDEVGLARVEQELRHALGF